MALLNNKLENGVIKTDNDLYAPWQPAENFILSDRKWKAAALLHKAGKFPRAGDKCLEIGYGKLGWLADLLGWGMHEKDLSGIEIDANRAVYAQNSLPAADLKIGDAANLPWEDESFKIVIASTVFSSIARLSVRHKIAEEIRRVLEPSGVLIWYDLAINNPKNGKVRGIGAKQVRSLFPAFSGEIKSVTLAPPIVRAVAPYSRSIATMLNAMPFLRTHLLGVLIKKDDA